MRYICIITNAEGDGGVEPDIVIPATVGLYEAQFTQSRDSLLDAAVDELKRQISAKKWALSVVLRPAPSSLSSTCLIV